jgi:LmbE family N-acetylglucosaminyl deacetylase
MINDGHQSGMEPVSAPPARLADALRAGARVAILAPHPDDESLGTGGLIQQAVAAGAEIRVLFITDGDNNPWPQRFVERRWFIDAPERARWGARRRLEGQRALDLLSDGRATSESLGLPDAGTLALWEAGLPGPRPALEKLFRDWRPTVVVVPSEVDRHPDHVAAHEYGLDAVRATGLHCLVYSYLIHRPWSQKILRRNLASDQLALTPGQQARKLAAIRCHETQMALSSGRFGRFASPHERYTLVQIS